jgi:outer membrane receptor for ferrienterochelin and colicins
MDLDVETVSGASRFEQKVTRAPASVSIVNSTEIKRFGYRTLAEIVQSVPGFYGAYDRNYRYTGARGFSRPGDYNTRILLLVDGHRMNDPLFMSAAVGNEFILDVDLIDRVEIIRGPGSSLYGSNAIFGIINVITRKASRIGGVELSGAAGSYDTYKGRATFGRLFENGLGLVLSATGSTSHGQSLYFKEFDKAATNSGWADGCDDEKYGNLFLNAAYKGFSLEGGYVSRKKTVPTGAWDTIFNDRRTGTTDRQGYVNLRFDKVLTPKMDLMLRAFYDYYSYDGDYAIGGPTPALNRDTGMAERWGGEAKYSAHLFEKHRLTLGLEFDRTPVLKQQNYDENPRAFFLDDSRKTYSWGAYAQDEFTILDNLLLNAGIRYDYYQTFGGQANPRLALIYSPLEKTTLKMIYGGAYRAPNAYELYYSDGGETGKANPKLDPETIQTFELVIEQYYKTYRFSVAAFYNKMDNLISQVVDPRDNLLVFKNAGETTVKGVEAELGGRFPFNIDGRLSYTYQASRDSDTGEALTNSPTNMVKLNVFMPLLKEKFGTGLEIQYLGPRKTKNGTDTGGYVVTNLTVLSQGITKDLELSGTLYNLFDKKYGDPASGEHIQNTIPQDGLSFRVKATYRFR